MADRITVYDDAGTKVILTVNDHLATGGEGSVYLKNNTIFKIYLEPAKARANNLDKKVELLKQLKHPGIVAPLGALFDAKGLFIGMTFPKIDGDPLCKMFTNTWRTANSMGAVETLKVVTAMHDIVRAVHSRKALLVDGNELNWLVTPTLVPHVIDVDSWQLNGFPATAIMPSIKDPHATAFNEGTDWYSWAIVTFQLWTGIHPFKGTHPSFERADLAGRMAANASVFDSKVKLPAAVRPFSDIPAGLLQWYKEVFNGKTRSAPPNFGTLTTASAFGIGAPILVSAGALKVTPYGTVPGLIRAAFNGFIIYSTAAGTSAWDSLTKKSLDLTTDQCLQLLLRQAALLRIPGGQPVLVAINASSGAVTGQILDGSAATTCLTTPARHLWQSGSRVFLLQEGTSAGLIELNVSLMATKLTVTVANQWPVSVLSSLFFNNMLVQDCLGKPFIGILEGNGLLQGPASALKGYKPLDGACLDRQNIWVTALRKHDGELVKLQFKWDLIQFTLVSESTITTADISALALPSGVGLLKIDDQLVVARGLDSKLVPVPANLTEAPLVLLGTHSVGMTCGHEIFSVSLGSSKSS